MSCKSIASRRDGGIETAYKRNQKAAETYHPSFMEIIESKTSAAKIYQMGDF